MGGKEKFFLTVNSNEYRGTTEMENHHLANTMVTTVTSTSCPWMLKLGEEENDF